VHAPCEDKSHDIKDHFYEELQCVFYQSAWYKMKILLRDFNVKAGKKDIFKLAMANESSHEVSNDNEVRAANSATSKNLAVKSTMFSHHDIHIYAWTFPGRKTHKQTDHVLIDDRQHSSILHVQPFRRDDCDTNHHLVVPKVRERLAETMDTDSFNLRKLNEIKVMDSIRSQTQTSLQLWNSEDNGNINRTRDTIRENIKISAKESLGYCESKHHKPRLDEKSSKLADRRKQAKLQSLQNPSKVNEDNLHNVRQKASRHFRNKKREYLKEKLMSLNQTVRIRTSETCIRT
jgi:hypothetical protein